MIWAVETWYLAFTVSIGWRISFARDPARALAAVVKKRSYLGLSLVSSDIIDYIMNHGESDKILKLITQSNSAYRVLMKLEQINMVLIITPPYLRSLGPDRI